MCIRDRTHTDRKCSQVVVAYSVENVIADDADVSSERKSAQRSLDRRWQSVLTTTITTTTQLIAGSYYNMQFNKDVVKCVDENIIN